MVKKFTYQGFELEELQKMPRDELIELLPARPRRSLKRGLTRGRRSLCRRSKESGKGSRYG